ncbi:MAG TPA: Crp/Fnr family transcriptional regulator [Stellaceae bacterium]|nr:Crp/Fnr family transcriptional regulator [Stellaceae bacterium]
MTLNLRPDRSILTNVPLFHGLDEAQQDAVLAQAHTRRVPKGGTAFDEGSDATALFVLVSGHMKAVKTTPSGQQAVVHFINPNDFFGCVALMGYPAYPATAVAVVDSVVLAWDITVLKQLMATHPQIAANALPGLGDRLRDAHKQFLELSTERVERRVAHALLRLVRHAGKKVDGGVEIDFPVTRQEIAEMIGTTLHTVSRVLSAWESQGILEGGRQRIVVKKPHALVAIAEELG